MIGILPLIVAASLIVSSPDFEPGGSIPSKFTCEGPSISPQLQIGPFPAGTRTLAIIMYDPDAPVPGGFTHWVVFNIDPVHNLAEEYQGGVQAMNGHNKRGYTGPCPPSGTHHYHFVVYALDASLDLTEKAGRAELEKAMAGHILAQGELVGVYQKMK
jgi:Raf kinase inhibitor-like YbhB/YbcL family protein